MGTLWNMWSWGWDHAGLRRNRLWELKCLSYPLQSTPFAYSMRKQPFLGGRWCSGGPLNDITLARTPFPPPHWASKTVWGCHISYVVLTQPSRERGSVGFLLQHLNGALLCSALPASQTTAWAGTALQQAGIWFVLLGTSNLMQPGCAFSLPLHRPSSDVSQAVWEYGLGVDSCDLTITGSDHLVIVWGNSLLYTDLHLPNAPILSFIFTVANPSYQQAAFQQRELFFKDDLGLSFSVSISSFALSSENAECAPDISFFLCGRTDMVSFPLLSLSWHHLGCARGMPQLDITTSSSLTMTISPFTAQRTVFLSLLSFILRTTPGVTTISAAAVPASPSILRKGFLHHHHSLPQAPRSRDAFLVQM